MRFDDLVEKTIFWIQSESKLKKQTSRKKFNGSIARQENSSFSMSIDKVTIWNPNQSKSGHSTPEHPIADDHWKFYRADFFLDLELDWFIQTAYN